MLVLNEVSLDFLENGFSHGSFTLYITASLVEVTVRSNSYIFHFNSNVGEVFDVSSYSYNLLKTVSRNRSQLKLHISFKLSVLLVH